MRGTWLLPCCPATLLAQPAARQRYFVWLRLVRFSSLSHPALGRVGALEMDWKMHRTLRVGQVGVDSIHFQNVLRTAISTSVYFVYFQK